MVPRAGWPCSVWERIPPPGPRRPPCRVPDGCGRLCGSPAPKLRKPRVPSLESTCHSLPAETRGRDLADASLGSSHAAGCDQFTPRRCEGAALPVLPAPEGSPGPWAGARASRPAPGTEVKSQGFHPHPRCCAGSGPGAAASLVGALLGNSRGQSQSQNVWGWQGPLWVTQPNPLPKQGHLHQAVEDLVQAGLEYLQRRRLHSLPGQYLIPAGVSELEGLRARAA